MKNHIKLKDDTLKISSLMFYILLVFITTY